MTETSVLHLCDASRASAEFLEYGAKQALQGFTARVVGCPEPLPIRCIYSFLFGKLDAQYHAARNQFERFRGFLELINRFEFEYCRREFFSEGFEFLVCSCECAVACLCPRNSISNVVASVTSHDDIKILIHV